MLLAPLALILSPELQEPASQGQPPPPASEWSTSLSTYWTEPPDESGYVSAILTADRGPLHLEAHWAYEARDTFSIFAGKNFPIEGDLEGHFTPRLGVAVGDAEGIVPALNFEVGWKQLSFLTDIEWMIGTTSDTDNFLYSWNELDWAVSERFTLGLVGQRTNVFDQELSVDRGFLMGLNLGKTTLTAYVFNVDVDDPYVSIAFGAGF